MGKMEFYCYNCNKRVTGDDVSRVEGKILCKSCEEAYYTWLHDMYLMSMK